ncbi:MAG: rnr, partial [Lacunisphaera sp.]|nr:rnr [Lacunisphaera sp.]
MSYSDRLISHLQRKGYVPASAEAIAREWRLNPKDRRKFNQQVGELVQSGRIAVIKGDRLCVPREADLVT